MGVAGASEASPFTLLVLSHCAKLLVHEDSVLYCPALQWCLFWRIHLRGCASLIPL